MDACSSASIFSPKAVDKMQAAQLELKRLKAQLAQGVGVGQGQFGGSGGGFLPGKKPAVETPGSSGAGAGGAGGVAKTNSTLDPDVVLAMAAAGYGAAGGGRALDRLGLQSTEDPPPEMNQYAGPTPKAAGGAAGGFSVGGAML